MTREGLRLGVNIDHVATLRQARGTTYPSVLEAAACCEAAGCDGITVHLREDRRHIQDADVYALKKQLQVSLNLEMANHPEIVRIALDVGPEEVCLVPERREELTTEGGLDVVGERDRLAPTVAALREAGICVSLFVAPDRKQLEMSHELGATYVELHTGTYCDAPPAEAAPELDRLVDAAAWGHALGLHINAGHGINLDNIGAILDIPHLEVLNIGHSIVSRAVFVGLENAVTEMRQAMGAYRGGTSAAGPS